MSTDAWKNENTKLCRIRLLKHSELYIALQKALSDESVTDSAYIRIALTEKLTRDGYLKKEE